LSKDQKLETRKWKMEIGKQNHEGGGAGARKYDTEADG
jgi:hypothetical protein